VSGEDALETSIWLNWSNRAAPIHRQLQQTPKLTGKSVMVTGAGSSAAIWWTESFRKRRLIWWWWITCSRKMENLDQARQSFLPKSHSGRFRLRGDEATPDRRGRGGSFQPAVVPTSLSGPAETINVAMTTVVASYPRRLLSGSDPVFFEAYGSAQYVPMDEPVDALDALCC